MREGRKEGYTKERKREIGRKEIEKTSRDETA